MWQTASERRRPITAEQAEKFLSRPNVSLITLRRILYRAPEPYKARAWKQLAKREKPDKLRGVLYTTAPREYRLKAAALMIKSGCAFNTILNHGLLESRARVSAIILEQEPVSQDLLQGLIIRAPEPYRTIAWQKYISANWESGKSSFLARNLHRFPKWARQEAEESLREKGLLPKKSAA